MNAHSLRQLLRRQNLVPYTAFILLSLVAVFGFVTSGAHPQTITPARNEREFKNSIPEHLPIKVKVKGEKSFKDLKNKHWLRELEVEVKNTGSKPIYYVQLLLDLPDVLVDGYPLAINLHYGRTELIYPETPVESGDMPILPGESITLKAEAQTVKGYEYHRDELRERDDPKRIVCNVTAIKFGDGTGLWGRDGKLVPPKHRGQSSNDLKQKNGATGCRSSSAPGMSNPPDGLFKVSGS